MESKEKTLKELMDEIDNNKLLLPHFQREFDWDKEKQKSLIASIFYDIPIGSLLFLEAETDMMTKTIGHKDANNSKNKRSNCYLMDGQQRLTTIKGIFDDFFKKNSNQMFDKLYNNLKNRWFFKLAIFDKNGKFDETHLRIILDLIKYEEIKEDKSISDIKNLIVQNKITKTITKTIMPFHPVTLKNNPGTFSDFLISHQYIALFLILSTTERSTDLSSIYKKFLIEPTQKIFKDKWFSKLKDNEKEKNKFIQILQEYNISINLNDREKTEKISAQWAEGIYETLRHFLTEKRKIPVLTYKDSFPKAVEAFTAMNTGGLRLSILDIIVAKYSALKKELLKDRIQKKFTEVCSKNHKLLPNIDTQIIKNADNSENKKFYNLYLNMLSIFSSTNPAIKEKNKLSLTKKDIDNHTNKAVTSIALAFRFLSGYCGVSHISKISYELMLLPIAKNLYDKRSNLHKKDILKMLYWYWSSLFGGRYREKQNSRSMEDIKILKQLLKPGKIEKNNTIEENFKKVFADEGYSDEQSLKNQTTPKLKDPILQFILTHSILNKDLNNFSKVTNKLQESEFEESHLISLNDFNKNRQSKQTRGTNHYINSVFNLALLPKNNNRKDRSDSIFSWPATDIKNYKILIPKKINGLNWNEFSIKVRDAKNKEELYEQFVNERYNKIEKTIRKYLKTLKEKWEKS